MSTPRSYARPPVVEALCEVYFANPRWDETVPGRFFDRIQAFGFSEKEPIERHEAMFSFVGGAAPTASVRPTMRMRFRTPDGAKIVQVEQGLLVVNQLAPYRSFAEWSPVIPKACGVFADLVESPGIERLGLRYINRIDLPGSRVDLNDWFTVSPRLPTAWQDTVGSFLVRAERKVGQALNLILTFGSAQATAPDMSSFLLDFYAVQELAAPVPVQSVTGLVEEAHACIESAFEGSITETLRTRFAPQPPG